MIDGIRKRLRPGSTGQAASKVDTTGQRMASQAAAARTGAPNIESGVQNWPIGLMSQTEKERADAGATPIPPHAPDDAGVLNRLFRLDVKDI